MQTIPTAHSVYLETFADTPLTPSKVVLRTHTGEVLEVSGEMQYNVFIRIHTIHYQ